jgi:nucleoside-triphosphatase THEP1
MIGVPALLHALDQGQVIVLDEIGPMEMRSPRFCQVVWCILDSGAPLVGTIVQRPHPFADRVRAHPRVTLCTVTLDNRERLHEEILAALRSLM